jgi:hypothetical protein
MFMNRRFRVLGIFTDVSARTLLYDHTFALPRMIWYLAMLCLLYKGYSGDVLVGSTAIIFGLYVLIGYMYFLTVVIFLKMNRKLQRYYAAHWWCILLLPIFNLMIFFIRIAGVINSIQTDSSWRTTDLTHEWMKFCEVVKKDAARPMHFLRKLRRAVNTS